MSLDETLNFCEKKNRSQKIPQTLKVIVRIRWKFILIKNKLLSNY